MTIQFKKTHIIAGIILLLLLAILPFSMTTVPANHVGIVYNAFNGGVQDKTLPNGFILRSHFLIVSIQCRRLSILSISRK